MTDRDTTTRTRARAPGVGGVFHRMAVHDRVLRPDSARTTVATTKCTKGGCKLDGGRRMPGAGLNRRISRKAPLGKPAFQPYWGKLAVRNDRGDRGNVGIIRSPIRASILPDQHDMMLWDHGMPRPDGTVSPEQRPEADVNIEFQANTKFADQAMKLAFFFRDANERYATDYPPAVGHHISNTDSSEFMNLVPAISLRE